MINCAGSVAKGCAVQHWSVRIQTTILFTVSSHWSMLRVSSNLSLVGNGKLSSDWQNCLAIASLASYNESESGSLASNLQIIRRNNININPDNGTHIICELRNSCLAYVKTISVDMICLMHLMRSRAVTNRIHFSENIYLALCMFWVTI